MPKQDKKSHKHHYEFAGPYLGPVGMIIGLPLLTFLYARFCNDKGWPTPSLTLQDLQPSALLQGFIDSWDTQVFLVYVAYWLY